MQTDLSSFVHELGRPHDPWEKFVQRNDARHRAEDDFRLCPQDATSLDVINHFFSNESRKIDDPIPRRRQLLREFLQEVLLPCHMGPQPRYELDIQRRSSPNHIVLLDDRQRHQGCSKVILQPCTICQIFSRNLTVSELCDRLKQEVSCLPYA